jgi:LPXTG-motif cell wall-anchored protein
MTIRMKMLVGAAALSASAMVCAQDRIGRAFTATGESCDQVTWSAEALRAYPRIASACREVMQRDGQYFVRFEGEVQRVIDQGRQVTVDFRDGDTLTLTPPENLSIYINDRPTEPRNLRPGDDLNFYIPQDQLAATFFAGQPETAPAQQVPITLVEPEETVAAATPARSVLPRTASALPWLGAAGLLLIGLGAALTVRRSARSST